MGSATTQALAATTAALDAASVADLTVARELFAAARVLGDSPQLTSALTDASATPEARQRVVSSVFAGFGDTTRAVLLAAIGQRWSAPADLVAGVEELAVRAASRADGAADVEGELFQVARVVAANPQLELALGSRLGDDAAKGRLIETLLSGRASAATTLIVSSLVQQPRDRRVRSLLSRALRIVAEQRGRTVATVYAASPLGDAQLDRLRSSLGARYGAQVAVNVVVDPSVVGGLRVEIGDDVIDATVSARLHELRQRLAG
ncbi:F0F1 ATP synthase subunit delta [Microbacterium sp. No. 7]|uniref:F0F1 ATP synthase subunit delta n=1 Tax=Microbacterium sp. No. 7 TaxID=1714373 RepID=UPI0006D2A754|nr:F0F1 ATP synthase subunit delta [Microbacterium sp. No. 7]ALJ21163.1 ATP synthase F0F1 subunit delta [Microbacterium sp. No. 7]